MDISQYLKKGKDQREGTKVDRSTGLGSHTTGFGASTMNQANIMNPNVRDPNGRI
jgi:hypothetical protein